MLKLKLQYFGHLRWSADSFEKTLRLGKIEGRRRRAWQRMRWLDGISDSMTWVWVGSGSWWWTGRPGVLRFTELQRAGHNWRLNWTQLTAFYNNSQKPLPFVRIKTWIKKQTLYLKLFKKNPACQIHCHIKYCNC